MSGVSLHIFFYGSQTHLINLVVRDAEASHQSFIDVGSFGKDDELAHVGHSRGLFVKAHRHLHRGADYRAVDQPESTKIDRIQK